MEGKIKLELSINEIDIIIKGLGELPLKFTFDLVNNIQVQIQNSLEENKNNNDFVI